MNNLNCGCCYCGISCCRRSSCNEESMVETRLVVIDFLYVDDSDCKLHLETEKNLQNAIAGIFNVLELAGIEIVLNKINVNSKELAIKHKFIVSPTIRVNGRDIPMETREIFCDSREEPSRDKLKCRVWMYKGQEYSIPPTALLTEGLLKSIFVHEDKPAEDV